MPTISVVHMHKYYSNSVGARAAGSANIAKKTDDVDNDDDDDDDEGGLSLAAIVLIPYGACAFFFASPLLTNCCHCRITERNVKAHVYTRRCTQSINSRLST